MSRIHKQVVSIQRNVGSTTANSGLTLSSASAAAQITKHSAMLITAEASSGVTVGSPIHYLSSGSTLQGATFNVTLANSPLYIPTRLHSFTGLTGGTITFLA